MAIKFRYPQVVLDKMKAIIDKCDEVHPEEIDVRYTKTKRVLNRYVRDDYVLERAGLGRGYLLGCLLGHHLEPSGRVLKNMGFELYIKDKATGELTEIDFHGRCEVDHSDPLNPKVRRVEEDA